MQNKSLLSSTHVTLDKAIVLVVVLSCILTSVAMLGPRVLGKSLTQEEAIEISRNTSTVERSVNFRRQYGREPLPLIKIEHWNTTYIASIKQEYSYMGEKNPYKFLPDDHGVWKLLWSNDMTSILHWIDDLTGQIIAQEYIG